MRMKLTSSSLFNHSDKQYYRFIMMILWCYNCQSLSVIITINIIIMKVTTSQLVPVYFVYEPHHNGTWWNYVRLVCTGIICVPIHNVLTLVLWVNNRLVPRLYCKLWPHFFHFNLWPECESKHEGHELKWKKQGAVTYERPKKRAQ